MGRQADRDYWDHILWRANIKPPIERHHKESNTVVITLKDDTICILEEDYYRLLDDLRDEHIGTDFEDNLGQ
jgi:hypothetical protein